MEGSNFQDPVWLRTALQGLAFWIGHRQSLYKGHPIPEAALITEACNLIQSNLTENQRLFCEFLYRNLIPKNKKLKGLGQKTRVDIVVVNKGKSKLQSNSNLSKHNDLWVIEAKRYSTNKNTIIKDLERLALIKICNPLINTILIVMSESKRPNRFVNTKGMALKKDFPFDENRAVYRIRRVCKASASFKKIDVAHYICAIEVLVKK